MHHLTTSMNLPSLQYNERQPRLPQGECHFRFPELSLGASTGRTCACENFSLDKALPGSICRCGHQAWLHISHTNESVVSKSRFDNLVRRLEFMELALEKISEREVQRQDEIKQSIQGLYSNLSLTSAQLENRLGSQNDRLEGVVDKVYELRESTRAIHKKVLGINDSNIDLAARFNTLETETEEFKHKIKDVATVRPSLTHRSSQRQERKAQAWSCYVLFVPHQLVRDPLNASSITYRRCYARGLLKLLGFDGPDERSFISAVNCAFSFVIRDRLWAPFIITLSSLGDPQPSWRLSLIDGKEGVNGWNRALLERYCVQKHCQGNTPTIVIGLRDEELSWDDIRALPSSQAEDDSLWQEDSIKEIFQHKNSSRSKQRSGSRSSIYKATSSGNPSPRSSYYDWEREKDLCSKKRRTSSGDGPQAQ